MNLIQKYYIKYTDRNRYRNIKNERKADEKKRQYNSHFQPIINDYHQKLAEKNELNFLHSGHLGDIIYSLPTLKKLADDGKKINLYLQNEKPIEGKYLNHPGNGFYLNQKLIDMLLPLLQGQSFINKVSQWNNEPIDIDLDEFRNFPFELTWHSNRWYMQLLGTYPKLEEPYLFVENHPTFQNKIVIIRTQRYQNPYVDYSFLNNEDDLLFIGLPKEFEELKKKIPNLEYYNPKDFKEMAQIIQSSRFYIGNQSLGYALAEALKVPRLLEADPDYPVVHPIGENAYDFFFQPHFEKLFEEFKSTFK